MLAVDLPVANHAFGQLARPSSEDLLVTVHGPYFEVISIVSTHKYFSSFKTGFIDCDGVVDFLGFFIQ